MEKPDVLSFLNLGTEKSQRADRKVWLGFFAVFTVFFVDVVFLLAFRGTRAQICVPVAFSALVFGAWILFFATGKYIEDQISYSILYNAVVTTLTGLEFYTISAAYLVTGEATLRFAHVAVLALSVVFWLATLIYRLQKAKSARESRSGAGYYWIVAPIVLLAVFFLRARASAVAPSQIISVLCLVVGGIWVLISAIYWQNFIVAKRHGADQIFREQR